MVDPRIYRGFLVLVAFAVIVFGFSLQNQRSGLGTSIAAGQFFSNTAGTMTSLAERFPNRAPGSSGDQGLATYVDQQFATHQITGFSVRTEETTANTAVGKRVLETVTASRTGLGGGTIVVISHRDATGSPSTADLSGTAVMLSLGRALSGETLHRSVMLVSTSGQVGAAGATQLAASLAGRHVDAVILLGDLASGTMRSPIVVPWSNTDKLAPPLLRKTLGAFVAAQTNLKDEGSGLAGQFARLAFPFAITEQAPFAARGIPAVLLSLSGDRPIAANAAVGSADPIVGLGAAVLQTVNALDSGPAVAAPSSYLLISGKVVPLWAVELLVLALMLPVAATTLDAVARTRRRGHTMMRWVGWVLTGAVPFVVGLVALLIARAGGLLSATPPGAVGDAGVKLTGGDTAVLGVVLLLVIASFVFLRPLCLRTLTRLSGHGRRPESPAADAAAVALSAVMCVLTLIVWILNPFAALLLVPALHVWLWLAQPGARSRRWFVAALVLVGLLPAALILFYYANAYGLSPVGLVWSLALMLGGALPIVASLYWSIALGCLASAVVIASRAVRSVASSPDQVVTVRGPASYAGPGSLGGTKSALRR
ncbi:MAG TPA: hypothetical protein VHV75_06845 [Solirubrobacteraceae bacterium]|jgi:hypothetical protein|nr:hypothetical protein [Solirubrobacteraceae bacterium]